MYCRNIKDEAVCKKGFTPDCFWSRGNEEFDPGCRARPGRKQMYENVWKASKDQKIDRKNMDSIIDMLIKEPQEPRKLTRKGREVLLTRKRGKDVVLNLPRSYHSHDTIDYDDMNRSPLVYSPRDWNIASDKLQRINQGKLDKHAQGFRDAAYYKNLLEFLRSQLPEEEDEEE